MIISSKTTFSRLITILISDLTVISAPSSPSNLSTVTLVGSDNSNVEHQETDDIKKEEAGKKVPETSDAKLSKTDTRAESVEKKEGSELPSHDYTIKVELVTAEVTNDEERGKKEKEYKERTEKVSSQSDEDKDPFDYKSREIRRGSMKLLGKVISLSQKDDDDDEEVKRKFSAGEAELKREKGKPTKRDTSSIFSRDSKKSSSGKKDKSEEKKTESKPERPTGRFSDGLLTIDSKFRRPRSKSAERRARPVFKRKGSEGVIILTEMKRKGSDGKFSMGSGFALTSNYCSHYK